jgi:hypothetical protein
MAFSTTDVGFRYLTPGFLAVGTHPDLFFQDQQGSLHMRRQHHVGTGIGEQNPRYRAIETKIGLPGQGWIGA